MLIIITISIPSYIKELFDKIDLENDGLVYLKEIVVKFDFHDNITKKVNLYYLFVLLGRDK